MLDKINTKKSKEKRKFILTRLVELGHLPSVMDDATEEQKEIYNQIWDLNFDFWEEVKEKNGWTQKKKLTQEEVKLRDKRSDARKYLRDHGYLPAYGEELTEEQQNIINQLESNDFTFLKGAKEINGWTQKTKLTEEEVFLRNKRANARKYLRDYEYLPEYGKELTKEQEEIIDQIERNSFSFLEQVKELRKQEYTNINAQKSKSVLNNTHPTDKTEVDGLERRIIRKMEGYTITSEPKNVFLRLRLLQILPPIGQEFNEDQQAIVEDVNENWFGKPKNFFISKYIYFSTPESRLFYRLHKSHRDEGFRFNITADDIVIPERCPLLDIPLSTDPKDKDEPNYYTGDRIDSSKGVIKGNIQVISLRANRMKNKATELELLTFATNGLKLLKDV